MAGVALSKPNPEPELYSGTSFDDLPATALRKICSALEKHEICLLRGVCLNWALLINDFFGIQLVVDNHNSGYLLTTPKYNGNVKHVKFINFTRSLPLEISFAPFLRELEFAGIVASYNLIKILNTLPALKHLTFSKIIMEKSGGIDLSEPFTPKAQLETLHVQLDKTCTCFTQKEHVAFTLLNYFDLSSLQLLKLGRTGDSNSITSDNEFSIEGKRESFSSKVYYTYRVLSSLDVEATISSIVVKAKDSLRQLFLENVNVLTVPNGVTEMPLLTELSGAIMYRSDWPVLLNAQRHLSILRLQFANEAWRDVLTCVQNCEKTLKELKLVRMYYVIRLEEEHELNWQGAVFEGEGVNLDFLTPITNLKSLHLEFPYVRKFVDPLTLPSTLEDIFLDSPISRDLLESILNNSPNLKRIGLKDFGNNKFHQAANEEFMDLELFKRFLLLPSIKLIALFACGSQRNEIVNYCQDKPGVSFKYEVATYLQETKDYITNYEIRLLPNFDRTEII